MKNGQALVVVLLVLGVVATVGLSVVSRSVTEVKQSTVQEESARALEAAEAGLERYLGGVGTSAGVITDVVSGGDAKFSLTTEQNLGLSESYVVPFRLGNGSVATLDLDANVANGITVCWGKTPAVPVPPAIIVTVYYKIGDEIRYVERGYDPEFPVRAVGWFRVTSGADNCGSSINFAYSKQINFTPLGNGFLNIEGGTPLFARVRMVYAFNQQHPVGFETIGVGHSFPLQAGSVESVGTSGDSVQKLRAVVNNYDMPGVFDYAIFSGGSLIKN